MVSHFLRNKKAFSLLELSIVMGMMALMTTSIIPMVVRSVEIKAAEKTITEVAIIQDAAKKFRSDQKAWPTNLSQMQDLGYLSPLWSLQNPWNNPYLVNATVNTFSVSVTVPNNLVGLLSTRLPQASVIDQTVTSVIGSGIGDNVPVGVIAVWSGNIANIPTGWVLCDGSNGTPDLRDKFVVGAREDEGGIAKTNIRGSLELTGGGIKHTHGKIGIDGNGSVLPHQLTIAEMPRHHHGYLATPWTGARYDGHSSPLMTQQVPGNTDDAGGDQPHAHSIEWAENLPPYYALAFIMKI